MRRIFALALVLSLGGIGLADFKILATEDVVKLVDGTEIRGSVIAVGMKAVIIAVGEKEVSVPRAQVESIVRGPSRSETLKYTTDPVDGLKVITGKGFRDGESGSAQGEGQKPAEPPKEKPAEKPSAPQAKPAAKPPRAELTPEAIKQYMSKNKALDEWVKKLGGPDKAAEFAKSMKKDALDRLLQGGAGEGK